jgi:hypothetical protein
VLSVKELVKGLKQNCERGFGFLFRQIDEASDDVWKTRGGKYLYWQHIYHTFVCVDFFAPPPGGAMDPGPGTVDTAMFKTFPEEPLSKDAVREYGRKKEAQAYAWIDGLEDSDLTKRNDSNSERRKMDVSNGMVISGLAGHIMYHVGCCDTTLRENGHGGVY